MSENPYERMMPPGPFGKAVDKAIAEANAQFKVTPEATAEAKVNAERWAALTAAQEVAQGHGVVLPIATVEEILKVIRGETSKFGVLDPDLLERMIEGALASAKKTGA